MEIRCHCTACGADFRVPDELAGVHIHCERCGAGIELPPPPPPVKEPPAEGSPPLNMAPPVIGLPPGNPPAAAPEGALAGVVVPSAQGAAAPQAPPGADGQAVREKPGGWQVWHTWVAAIAVGIAVSLVLTLGRHKAEVSAPHVQARPATKTPAAAVAAVEPGVLVLEIPEAERPGASVSIDDEKKEVAARGPLEYRLAAGEHRVQVVCGGRHAEQRLSLKAGQKCSYQPAWSEDHAPAAMVVGDIPAPNWVPGADVGKGEAARGPSQDSRIVSGNRSHGGPGSTGRNHAGPGQRLPLDESDRPQERRNVARTSLPSLDGVTWAEGPVAFRDLRGKTVIMLVYDYATPELSAWTDEFLDQLKEAIRDKPVVVLAIDIAKSKLDVGPAYLRARHFTLPNIVLGHDSLMPSRLRLKHAFFHYAWIDPAGRLTDTGHALLSYRKRGRRLFALPLAVVECPNLGTFAVLDAAMSAKVKNVLWPLELGRLPAEAALKKAEQDLTAVDAETVDAAVAKFLDGRLEQVRQLSQGTGEDRLWAHDQVARLAAAFKTRDQGKQAKELLADIRRDSDCKRELDARRAYEKTLQQVDKNPAARDRLMRNLATQHKGTYYGQQAARGGGETLSCINAWPALSEAEQTAAVQKQRAFFEEVRTKLNDDKLLFYETKRFLVFSDLPASFINTLYVPNLDEMYVRLCGVYGIKPAENVWRGKATILAFAAQDNFQQFERVFYHGNRPGAQGLEHPHEDGTVVISCFAGDDPKYLATVMVHETTHGFNWRYKAAEYLPSWVDEGAAEWVASHVVTCDDSIHRKVLVAMKRMQATRSLGGDFFTADQIAAWQYGVAVSITDFLLKYEPSGKAATAPRAKAGHRYRDFIEAIKLGMSWEDALKKAYGLSPADLVRLYGQTIGIPDLKP
jgi:hypothetical protein